jgi:hypothetical protein
VISRCFEFYVPEIAVFRIFAKMPGETFFASSSCETLDSRQYIIVAIDSFCFQKFDKFILEQCMLSIISILSLPPLSFDSVGVGLYSYPFVVDNTVGEFDIQFILEAFPNGHIPTLNMTIYKGNNQIKFSSFLSNSYHFTFLEILEQIDDHRDTIPAEFYVRLFAIFRFAFSKLLPDLIPDFSSYVLMQFFIQFLFVNDRTVKRFYIEL